MFYEVEVRGHVRVHPTLFNENTEVSILKSLNEQFNGFISNELGVVIGVVGIKEVHEGIIIPGDGAAYYDTICMVLSFKPEIQEVVLGKVSDITDFGAFINIGPIDGMIHVSQTMDDFVSFSKSNILTGKDSKKSLKVGDNCRARIIAVSYKDISNPKINLTMRQAKLGTLQWIEDDLKRNEKKAAAPEKETKKETKEKKK